MDEHDVEELRQSLMSTAKQKEIKEIIKDVDINEYEDSLE